MLGLFTQIPKQKGVPSMLETTVIPPPPPRIKQSGENDSQKEKWQIFIKPEEFERLLQEWLKTEPEGFEVDEDKLEELEEYIEYRRKLRELTSQMVEEELERYIVEEKMINSRLENSFYAYKVTCNSRDIGYIRVYELQKSYCITDMVSFKQIMAALGNPFISYAFPKNKEGIYINFKQYIFDQGGTIERLLSRSFDNDTLEITLEK